MRGLDPRIHSDAPRLRTPGSACMRHRSMDCRVKPGNDAFWGVRFNSTVIRHIICGAVIAHSVGDGELCSATISDFLGFRQGGGRTCYFYFPGNLWPLAAKALPKAFLSPPPAGFTWHFPHGKPVCAA